MTPQKVIQGQNVYTIAKGSYKELIYADERSG